MRIGLGLAKTSSAWLVMAWGQFFRIRPTKWDLVRGEVLTRFLRKREKHPSATTVNGAFTSWKQIQDFNYDIYTVSTLLIYSGAWTGIE